MPEPPASRPHMPGYGIAGPTEGRGLLPWSWAEERLTRSHDYWVATVRADGRPHLMPVWGAWDGGALWFSIGRFAGHVISPFAPDFDWSSITAAGEIGMQAR